MIEPPQEPVDVLIESPRFSCIKRKPDGGIDFISPVPCPFNYGCVPTLISGDGDPIDVVLLGPRLPRGAHVQAHVVAVVDFIDAGDLDPKWICSNRPMTTAERASVRAFFTIYAQAKRMLNALRRTPGLTVYRGLHVAPTRSQSP